jgi:hypothetical protein
VKVRISRFQNFREFTGIPAFKKTIRDIFPAGIVAFISYFVSVHLFRHTAFFINQGSVKDRKGEGRWERHGGMVKAKKVGVSLSKRAYRLYKDRRNTSRKKDICFCRKRNNKAARSGGSLSSLRAGCHCFMLFNT